MKHPSPATVPAIPAAHRLSSREADGLAADFARALHSDRHPAERLGR